MSKLLTNQNGDIVVSSDNNLTTDSSEYTPPPVTGYSIWLDASNPANLELDGNNVIAWKDNSEHARDVLAPSVPLRPVYNPDRAGKPAVEFNTVTRAGQYLKATANVISYTDTYTFFIVHDYSGFSSDTIWNLQTAVFSQGTDSQHNVMLSTAFPGYNAGSDNQPLLDTYPPLAGGARLNTRYTLNQRYITVGRSDGTTRMLRSSSGDTGSTPIEIYTGAPTPEFVLGNLIPSGGLICIWVV